MELFEKVIHQKQSDKGNLYWIHQPDTASMTKGKAHKKDECGHQVGWITTSGQNMMITAIKAFEGHPHDRKTIEPLREQHPSITSQGPKELVYDQDRQRKKKETTRSYLFPKFSLQMIPHIQSIKEEKVVTQSRHRTNHRTPQNTTPYGKECPHGYEGAHD